MKKGIVILNYNTYEITCELIRKILNFKSVDKIVLVDNDSKDDFSDFCEEVNSNKLEYIKNDINLGYAGGNNIGLKYLYEKGYDVAFIANPDVIFNNQTIELISNFLYKNRETYAIASCSRTMNNMATGQYWWIPKFSNCLLESIYIGRRYLDKRCIKKTYKTSSKDNKKHIDVEVVGGAFFGCNLTKIKEINFFDENTFLWYEENILSYKIKQKNWKIALLLDCKYEHNHIKKGHGNPNFKYFLDSKRYYCYKYLNINQFQKIILRIFDFIGEIEERMICLIYNKK